MSKLTESSVADIKSLLANGAGLTELAKRYGVARGTIHSIQTGRTWSDVEAADFVQPSVEYNPLDDHIVELEGKNELLRKQLAEARKVARKHAHTTGLITQVTDELVNKIQPVKRLPGAYSPKRSRGKVEEHLVLHISDGHHDCVVPPESVDQLEDYNFRVSCVRAEKLINTAIHWSQEILEKSYSFPVLHVFAGGDCLSGTIHSGQQHLDFSNSIQSSIAVAQLYTLMLRDLAPHFEEVNVLCLSGNHGRRTLTKEHEGPDNNWDYLIMAQTRAACHDIPNIHFSIPKAYAAQVDILGHGFLVSHGDEVKGSGGVPFVNMQKRHREAQALRHMQNRKVPDYYCIGHHHVAGSLASNRGEMLVNGAWLGTDRYSFNEFTGYREPMQLMHGVHRDHGVTWRAPIRLRQSASIESKGPKRYKVEV